VRARTDRWLAVLRNDQWDRIKEYLPGKVTDRGVKAKANRRFVEAVLWINRTGSPWRDLPEEFGHWHRVYVRYNRWSKKGVWTRLFEVLSQDQDLEYLMVDGSITRVHQHGTPKKKPSRRSRRPIPWRTEHEDSCGGGCVG
jgi:transposase